MIQPESNVPEQVSEQLETWLQHNVEGYRGRGTLQKFPFGQSNPTFRLSTQSAEYVLRRKPLGALLPKAHAIEREYRVLHALEGSAVPVPRVYALCSDTTLLGAAFYVMDFVKGRIFYDQRLPGLSPVERKNIFDGMNAAVAALHLIDPLATGLSGYGHNEQFLSRQVALWTNQYRASADGLIPAMEALIDWLPRHLPPERPVRIFHGDLRLDNMVFHPTEPRVTALLDWELSTLGDPIADFAYHALAWRVPFDLFRGFVGLDLEALGIPSESTYVARYCRRTGMTELPHWNFYLAFCLFRLAAILQGVGRRAKEGNASASDAAELGARAAPLAALGWDIANGGSPI
jgi:aminoglycoside phosphotransferase (APT) family kinase protein